jgi:hypothetical protein
VLVVLAPDGVDGATLERRAAVEGPTDPVEVAVGGVEVDALVAGEAEVVAGRRDPGDPGGADREADQEVEAGGTAGLQRGPPDRVSPAK